MLRSKTAGKSALKSSTILNKSSRRPVRKSSPRKYKANSKADGKSSLFWLSVEILGLLVAAAMATMLALGYVAQKFTGTGFFLNLLPFAIGVVACILAGTLFLLIWRKLRVWLLRCLGFLPAMLALGMASATVWYILNEGYTPVFTHFRALVGGRQQAERTTLAHQVYAAYRRYDEADLQKLVTRSQGFDADIKDAAGSFELDRDILLGVAATESSFMPRDSKDGGHGLFQITAVPKFIMERARQRLSVDKLSVLDSRHNAFIAAATLKHYLAEMNGDLFLGLLAYNIGPRNGGLKFIMEQYGANDFVTMQPYLQQLPRDYPIRVLSYSLAFRLWHQEGRLLAYQDGANAVHIQRIGIPGLENGL